MMMDKQLTNPLDALADDLAQRIAERLNRPDDPTVRALVVRIETLAAEHGTTPAVVKGWIRNGLPTHPMPSAGTWVLRSAFTEWVDALASESER